MNEVDDNIKPTYSLLSARLTAAAMKVISVLLLLSALVLPYLQKSAMKPVGSFLSPFEVFLIQLPKIDGIVVAAIIAFAAIVAWMGCVLGTLVALTEVQLDEWEDDQ